MDFENVAKQGLETLIKQLEDGGVNDGQAVLMRMLFEIGSPTQSFASTYVAEEELGRGGYSIVKRGTHRFTGNKVAVKIVAKNLLSSADFVGLESECNLLREMNHPHIIKCFETFDEDQSFYIITELVEGGDLFERIISKSIYTEEEARDLIKLLLETMAYVHECGIVHRDLKPENIMLTSKADNADIKVTTNLVTVIITMMLAQTNQ